MRRLLPLLRDRGLDCRCLFLTHFGGTGPVVEELIKDGFDCAVVDCHSRTEEQVRWILQQVELNPPDVFVPNLVVSAYHAAQWIRDAGISTVGVLHSDDAYYQAIQDEFVFGASQQCLSSVVCVSAQFEEQVRARNPRQTEVIRIPYGVHVPENVERRSSDRLRIAYVGRLAEEQKRISETTRALIQVCREIPNVDAVLFGDGPDRNNVERILASEGSGVSVSLAGNIANSEIQQRLQQFDVITLLSDYEGLPIALLEGMACGCVPVCVNMRSGIPELVQHEVTGLIVSDRAESFVAAIRRLVSNAGLRNTLAQNARQTIVERYSQNHSADLWAEHLRQLSQHSSAPRFVAPRRIVLPKRNPALESEEQRMVPPSSVKQFLRRTRMWAGKVRRRLL